MDVHPGLLFREIDRLVAINFPQVGLGEQPIASSQLARAGFVVTESWDGRRPMPLVVSSLARVESREGPEHEEALLGLRERSGFPRAVVTRLNAWLDTLRRP
jgi:SH3-like domain-containing protein